MRRTPAICLSALLALLSQGPMRAESASKGARLSDRLATAKTFKEALEMALPQFENQTDGFDLAASSFAGWANGHLEFSDVSVARDETSFASARKEIARARGKRLCIDGKVDRMEVIGEDDSRMNNGLLLGSQGAVFNFLAVRSAGALAPGSEARICGVVTGLRDFHDAGGKVIRSVFLVGMFDLPENRGAKAATR